MLNVELEVPVECIYKAFVACDCLESYWRDEVARILCHDDMHVGIQLDKHGCKVGYLIGCYAACNAEDYGLVVKHTKPEAPQPPKGEFFIYI